MKAIVMERHGGPDVLTYQDAPTPEPARNQVQLQVHALSVNRTLDCRVRAGSYHIKPPLPHVLGNDPAGVISAIGEDVTNVKVGDRVTTRGQLGACGRCEACMAGKPGDCRNIGLLGVTCWGGGAQYVCVPAPNVSVIGGDLSFADACVINRHHSAAFNFLHGLAEL